MSNVVPLFKEVDRAPAFATGALEDVMQGFVDYAERQGVDTRSTKFLYECASIMTLMQVTIHGLNV